MKTSVIAIVLLLVIGSFSSVLAGPFQPSICCRKYVTRNFLKRMELKRYFIVYCPKKSVVFVTSTDMSYCADPDDEYVKQKMKELPRP